MELMDVSCRPHERCDREIIAARCCEEDTEPGLKCMFQVYLSYSISMTEEAIKTFVALFGDEWSEREGIEWVHTATCER